MLEIWAAYIFPLLILAVAFFSGNMIASRHEKSLSARQLILAHIRTTDLNRFFEPDHRIQAQLFTAEITLGIDHFRGFLGSLKNIFGGQIRSYQKTLDRARREALMQVIEQSHSAGYNAVANLRLEFVDISGKANMAKRANMVTIIAYGTAYTTHAPLNKETQTAISPLPAAIR
ncbi:heavy metal-binding domain-containing protein [Kiritimatiellaeota bacterium B1221]|nr:heavy metal-binding domain-containing protein [Kiritimatiellaeota bacterium B1221]